MAATNFYQAGLDSAQQTLQAFVDRFGVEGKGRKRLMGLMDKLAAAMKRETTITVTTINRVVSQKVDGKRALGGPVASGKAYLVGERGPEVMVMGSGQSGQVIPNSDLSMTGRSSSSGSSNSAGTTINLTVNAGMGANGAQIGQQIVEEIKRFERSNGPQFVSA